MTKDILGQIAAASTVAQAWQAVANIFAAHTHARSMNVRLALTTTKKGAMAISEYVAKMRGLGDEMAAAGKPLDDEEMVAHILNGLGQEYNSLVSSLMTRVEPILLTELYSQLLSFETRLDLQQGGSSSSAYAANRGGRGDSGCGRSTGRKNRGGRGGFGRGGHGNDNQSRAPNNNQGQQRQDYSNNSRPRCQVCFKKGHLATECWYRFNEDYVADEKLVSVA